MASSYNTITIIGHLGRDPASTLLPSGDQVTEFSVATSERRRGADGQPRELTTWFRVHAFGALAEIAAQYLRKGSAVFVDGPLTERTYTDRTGQPRTSLDVRARALRLLDRREEAESAEPPATDARGTPVSTATPAAEDDSEYPF